MHRAPQFLPIYIDLAQTYGLPVRGGEGVVGATLRDAGVPSTTKFVRGWSGQRKSRRFLEEQIIELRRSAKPKDVPRITCHPGHVDDSLSSRTTMTIGREEDYRQLLELRTAGWFERHDLRLVPYSFLSRRA